MSNRDQIRDLAFWCSIAAHSVLATCDRLRTACGIVQNKRLHGVGFNGSVSGLEHCDDANHHIEDNHCLRTRHGEANAITNTPREHLRGGRAMVIATPCIDCIKDLAEEGIARIDYVGDYANAKGKEFIKLLCEKKNIELKQHEIDWADLFQNLFDLLARKGGILCRAGYRLKITKEPFKESR